MLDAPHAARFASPPHVEVAGLGEGEATFTLRLGRDVDLGRHTVFEIWAGGTNALELGDRAFLMQGVRLQLRSGAVTLGADSHARDGAVLKSYGELRVGRACRSASAA